jgi:hypothetical protein
MGNEFKEQSAHSAEYFGDTRDHWWNADFLQLMARRWKLDLLRPVSASSAVWTTRPTTASSAKSSTSYRAESPLPQPEMH